MVRLLAVPKQLQGSIQNKSSLINYFSRNYCLGSSSTPSLLGGIIRVSIPHICRSLPLLELIWKGKKKHQDIGHKAAGCIYHDMIKMNCHASNLQSIMYTDGGSNSESQTFAMCKVSRMEWMLVVEPDPLGAFLPVGAQGISQITSYATVLTITYGGILSIQQRNSISNLPRLSGMDLLPLSGHTTYKTSFSAKTSSLLRMKLMTQILLVYFSIG